MDDALSVFKRDKNSGTLTCIEFYKDEISKSRNELRKIVADVEDCLDSFDSGIEYVEDGLSNINIGIEDISTVV